MKDWSWPKTLLFAADDTFFQASLATIVQSGKGSDRFRKAFIATGSLAWRANIVVRGFVGYGD